MNQRDLTTTASHSGAQVRVRLASSERPAEPAVRAARPTAFVVHRDRVLRASRARALLGAQFDVEAFDDVVQLVPALKAKRGLAVLVIELAAASPAALGSIVEAADELLVVALSNDRESASGTLQGCGVLRFIVAPRGAPPAELAKEARQLVSGTIRM